MVVVVRHCFLWLWWVYPDVAAVDCADDVPPARASRRMVAFAMVT